MATTLLHWAARGVPDKRCTWGSLVPAELTHQSLRLRHWVPHSHSCHFLSQIPSLSMPGQSLLVVVENRKRAVEYCRTKHTAWIWGPDVLQRLQEDERSVILRPRATPEPLYVDTHREPDRDLVFSRMPPPPPPPPPPGGMGGPPPPPPPAGNLPSRPSKGQAKDRVS